MSKSRAIIAGILIALLPWMSGGRAPLAVMIGTFSLLAVVLLQHRATEPSNTASLFLRLWATAWLGWGVLSLTWSVNRFQTEQWILYVLMAISVFTVTARLSSEHKRQLINGYVWLATATAVVGFGIYASGSYERLTSTFYWANPCAAFLLPAIVISSWEWATHRRWFIGVQALVLATALWLTDSRGALIALTIVTLGALMNKAVRRKALWLVALALVSFGISFGASAAREHFTHHAAVSPGSRFSEAAQGESTSGNDRRNYLTSTFEIWKDHPLRGTGAGTFGTVHPQYQQRVISASNDAHNVLAQTFAEQGLIGALILIYVGLLLLWGIGRGVRRNPAQAPVALGAIVLALHFGVDIDDRYPALIVLLAILTGVSYQPWWSRPLPSRRRMTLMLLVLVAVALSVGSYLSDAATQRGKAYDDNHDLKTAASSYAKAHTGLVYDPDAWTAEGIDYYTIASITGGSDQYLSLARDRAKQAIAHDDLDSQHYLLLGRVERLAGHPKAAEQNYRYAIQLDPWNHPDYYLDLATLYVSEKQPVAAKVVVDRALKLYPADVVANRNADPTVAATIPRLKALQQQLGQ